jgi:delta 1-pyrroline-5-carboxylate dehydrogenase
MVRYSTWTSIAFDVAKAKGVQFEGNPPTASAQILSVAAEIWSEDKEKYLGLTEEQARRVLEQEITVS